MADVVVTVPKRFGWQRWIDEGDPAGAPWSGERWGFYLGGHKPKIAPGERVYIVHNGRLRGYAPLIALGDTAGPQWFLERGGGAVAVTIPEAIRGFQGWRYRWWDYADEVPFPEWRAP